MRDSKASIYKRADALLIEYQVKESQRWQGISELNRADIIHALVAKRAQATVATNDEIFHREAIRFGARAKFADEITRNLPF